MKLQTAVPFSKQPGGDESRFYCPFCDEDEGKLYINWRKRLYFCFKCGAKGTLHDSFRQVADLRAVKRIPAVRTYPGIVGSGVAYLRKHNVSYEIALNFGVKSGAEHLEGRLVFPARRRGRFGGSRTVFRSAHSTRAQTPKSIAIGKRSPMVLCMDRRGNTEYPKEEGSRLSQPVAIITEGPADALRWITYKGHGAAVALFGKTMNEDDAVFLSRCFNSFILVLDDDAREKSVEMMHMLEVFSQGQVEGFTPEGDLASMPEEFCDRLGYRVRSLVEQYRFGSEG